MQSLEETANVLPWDNGEAPLHRKSVQQGPWLVSYYAKEESKFAQFDWLK